ncbi:TPA: hypothetical protein HA251_05555 [Candidatus Woesearchaeota archaeon]|nr:hypothetical protein [Candidatus Woesearchaeota archaeon]
MDSVHRRSAENLESVKNDRPFAHFLGEIQSIEPLIASNALSGNAFFVACASGKYKLRVCDSEARAKTIEDNLRRFPNIFPKFYGRDGRYILTEALVGYRGLTNDDLRRSARKIGRLCAEVNSAEANADHDHRQFFITRIAKLLHRGIIDRELHDRVLGRYEQSLDRVTVRISLDMNDLHKGNFMIDKDDNILFIDEEGINPRMRGQGVAKLLRAIGHEDEYREFMAGYNEVADGSFLTPEYLAHMHLVELVRTINFKTEVGVNLDRAQKDLDELRKFCA